MDHTGDDNTTVGELKGVVKQFCEARDWDQFHDMKELAIGLVTESSELLDIMRFKTKNQLEQFLTDPQARERISDELADIAWMLLRFSQLHGFDLTTAMRQKTAKNQKKYPVETARGSNRKYNET